MNSLKIKPIIVLILNIILSVSLCIINVFYQLPAPKWDLTLKFIGSGICVLLGVLNLLFGILNKKSNCNFAITMVVGLFLSFGGDIAIEYNFIAGAGLFALAHICYVVGFFFISKFHWLDIVITVAFAIPSTLLIGLLPVFNFNPPLLKYVVIIYAVIISCMFGKSLSNCIRERSFHSILIFIGALMFVLSDFFLLLELFTSLGWKFGHPCMALYFPALLVFGYSIYYSNKNLLK